MVMNKKIGIAKKIGMTEIIDAEGLVEAATILQFEPYEILAITPQSDDSGDEKGDEKGGDTKVRITIGFNPIKESKCTKPQRGQFKKYGTQNYKFIREYEVLSSEALVLNAIINAELFEENEVVNVRAKTKGCGFAGTIKRHHFSRGPMSHGSKNHRLPGSIGGGTDPGRVLKGTKMGGRLGNKFVTTKNLKVLKVDTDKNIIYIKGAVPGANSGMIELTSKEVA